MERKRDLAGIHEKVEDGGPMATPNNLTVKSCEPKIGILAVLKDCENDYDYVDNSQPVHSHTLVNDSTSSQWMSYEQYPKEFTLRDCTDGFESTD